jgi:hypothetical protein
VIAVTAALALIWLSPSALAYWSNAGEVSATASVATLSAPTISSATPGAEAVELAWAAVIPPSTGTVEYFVSRDGGAPSGGCPSSSSHSTVTSCTDTGVSIGTHEYTVTAVWRSWTASAAKSATITFGPATHLQLEAASATPTAGEADNLTITAKDASNNTVGSYTGSHSLVFEGATEAPSGTKPVVIDGTGVEKKLTEPTEITFTEGRAVVSSARNGVMKLYRAEEAHIKVKEGSLNNGAGLAVKVAPGTFKRFLVAQSPSEPEAGSAFEVKLTAWDEWHNTITSYARTNKLQYAGAEASPSGTAPEYSATTEPTFSGGEATVTGFKLYKAASTTLTVKEEVSGHEGTSAAFTVKAAATTKKFSVPTPSEQTAGTAFSVPLTATDEWGNKTTGYTGSKTLVWSGPSNSPSGQAPSYPSTATTVTFTAGEGTASSITLYKAASTTLKVKEGTIAGTAAAFTVKADAATRLAFTTSPSTPTAENTVFATQPKVTVQDAWQNTATTNTSNVTLTPSGATLTCTANPKPAAAGVAKFAGCKMNTAGTYTLTATDGALTSAVSSSFTIS